MHIPLDELTPAADAMDTLHRGVKGVFTLDENTRSHHIDSFEKRLDGMVKHLDELAKGGDKKAGKLGNILYGLHEHVEHVRKHHGNDPEFTAYIKDLGKEVKNIFDKHKGDQDALITALESQLKQEWGQGSGTLLRSPDLAMYKEYGFQVQDNFKAKGVVGKMMSVVGGTVSLGVIAHGVTNIKRGMFGYQDAESGEQKKGSLSNLVLGAGEIAAGIFALKKSLTGQWGMGRAAHARAPHTHDHEGHHHH